MFNLSPEYQAQEMKKFSFFHPNNGSKPEETQKNIPCSRAFRWSARCRVDNLGAL